MVHDGADVPEGPANLDLVQVRFDEQRLVSKGYGQDKAEKSISRRRSGFAANCGTGALGLPAGRVASAA